jgi:hypothetical protein
MTLLACLRFGEARLSASEKQVASQSFRVRDAARVWFRRTWLPSSNVRSSSIAPSKVRKSPINKIEIVGVTVPLIYWVAEDRGGFQVDLDG